jgi:hypothetical protein
MKLEDIYNWIVYTGGICPTDDNHFGGPSGIKSQLNLKIQQRPTEIAGCVEFFLSKKESGEQLDYYAEIGPCAGGTTRTMYNFLKFKEILIIDVDQTLDPNFYSDRGISNRAHNLKDIPKIEIIGLSSDQQVLEEALTISKNQQYDILLIDGDHSYMGVKNDTINYLPIVREGGYLIFHDTAHIHEIKYWLNEIPSVIPNLKKVVEFHHADRYTPAYPYGIGLTVFQKT